MPRENYTIAYEDLWRTARGRSTAAGFTSACPTCRGRPKQGRAPGGTQGWFLLVAVPFVYPLALTAAASALVARARVARRSRAGACKPCGHDLTGNVSGVCPECGAAARAPT